MKFETDGYMASCSIDPPGYTMAYCITKGQLNDPQPGDRVAYTGSYKGVRLITIRDVDRMDEEAKKKARLEIRTRLEQHHHTGA